MIDSIGFGGINIDITNKNSKEFPILNHTYKSKFEEKACRNQFNRGVLRAPPQIQSINHKPPKKNIHFFAIEISL